MRPIDRGTRPSDPDGKPMAFRNYQEAKPYLESRLGEYCSYDAAMCRKLIEAFPGTCHKCFDKEGKPIPRQGKPVKE